MMLNQNIFGDSILVSHPLPLAWKPCLIQQKPTYTINNIGITRFNIFVVSISFTYSQTALWWFIVCWL